MYPPSFGSKAAADCKGGSNDRPSVQWKVEAMAGSPDAMSVCGTAVNGSVSPSCPWHSCLRNNERQPQCSIFTVLSSSGEGASSS
jgi:hypothetical protein